MRGRRRFGKTVADAHQVVKASSRQQESQTPTQWCGKVTRVYRRTDKEWSSWERQIGHAHFVARELQAKTEEHSVLFRRILAVPDLQCAWLLLLFCAATRANYFLRVVQPAWAERFAFTHDENVWNCTQELLDIEGTVRVRQLSSLPLAFGGLGPRSAIRSQNAASWASWADSLPRIRERHPKHCGPHRRHLVPREIP